MNPLHFLVADESKGVRAFLQQLLEGYGFDQNGIRMVSTPESALQAAAEFKPDFLVTDWFPDASLSGIDLYKQVKETNPRCRLALLSKEITPQHEAEAKAAGSRFLLVKPFTAVQLKDEIKKALTALTAERPDLVTRLNAVMAAPPRPRAIVPPSAALPIMNKLKPGDHVIYGNKEETIDYVVLRGGELIAHLHSKAGFVPVEKLRKA